MISDIFYLFVLFVLFVGKFSFFSFRVFRNFVVSEFLFIRPWPSDFAVLSGHCASLRSRLLLSFLTSRYRRYSRFLSSSFSSGISFAISADFLNLHVFKKHARHGMATLCPHSGHLAWTASGVSKGSSRMTFATHRRETRKRRAISRWLTPAECRKRMLLFSFGDRDFILGFSVKCVVFRTYVKKCSVNIAGAE